MHWSQIRTLAPTMVCTWSTVSQTNPSDLLEQSFDNRLSLPQIPRPKQIQVIQHVIEVVQLDTLSR